MKPLYESNLTSLPLINKGKVRDLYDVDDKHLLIVTTDRISAFDVVLPTPIPGKGRILTETAVFWMKKAADILPNQLADDVTLADILTPEELEQIQGRGMVVKKLKPLPVEAIVRGYLVGSGWKEYKKTQTVCGIPLPEGLKKAEQLPEPLFTPSTKAAVGEHDENISFEEVVKLMGEERAQKVKEYSLALYKMASEFAAERGIIIADTKFEFGEDENGVIHLIDEALTPDSSRFWPAKTYQVGKNPDSFDKQYIRDYLESLDWDKTAPGPELPEEIVDMTLQKYQEAQSRLMENL
ncbi:phosphoribosylaminoimidazolesuccinocarboxamide synthase [Hydrogenovibrio marinus]|uniref:Phosphoribosylaminoimidazole-succinocarboxamide synthase n=1 Tax=Hydrogenovibrio marinus TaxID=28885 RepID=A0A066ZU61_HYDMR|nr:phosphoribosylaminoimidazolesuccinocarboxamide synthase [Hydrogenovibrio marinus]KDN95804.1 phosphoribosylaminoimidazole-succinocarboxamide synthase [Hydrogenovibrio marinus]BBN58709.1 phosphoribosylaminoimidazole-succinocarboxamide synthase [Hydrogenovibrio marinus]